MLFILYDILTRLLLKIQEDVYQLYLPIKHDQCKVKH